MNDKDARRRDGQVGQKIHTSRWKMRGSERVIERW